MDSLNVQIVPMDAKDEVHTDMEDCQFLRSGYHSKPATFRVEYEPNSFGIRRSPIAVNPNVPKFIRFKHILVDGLTHHSEAIFPSLPVKEGDKVLDVGCGFGDTAIQLARRVGPGGSVTGIDCCQAFLEVGRKDAAAAGLSNVTFFEGDVQSHPFKPEYDFVFSRFGTMFFENPVWGLRNMLTAMKPGGLMTMIVWRTVDDNPWLGLPK